MPPTIEFFFDYGSPYSYLANTRIAEIAEAAGAELVHRPMLLGGVFKATGNQSPMMEPVEPKRAYGGLCLSRTANAFGVPMTPNPHFPINTLMLMRTALAAQQDGCFERFHEVVYPAFWNEGLDLGDADVLASLLEKNGLPGKELIARGGEAPAKDALRANTEEAVSRGAFGAPTFFYEGEMYFGADHLPFLEQALAGS